MGYKSIICELSTGGVVCLNATTGGVRVVAVEIITLYQVQTGRFLATTGYVAPSPNHGQNNVQKRAECISTNRLIKETGGVCVSSKVE